MHSNVELLNFQNEQLFREASIVSFYIPHPQMIIQHVLISTAWGLVFPTNSDGNWTGCWNKGQWEARRKLAFLNRIDDLTDAAQLSLDPLIPVACKGGGFRHSRP